ncbi:MAG TPA: winged helix-turn-helix domain-containing protein [Pyrinomonadaceae bacterium]|jgi:DNA-binding winged helix-turn-helix (wHTH) protein
MTPGQENRIYGFGDFTLQSRERLLFRNGEIVNLTPKAFDVLVILLQANGQLVEKKTLLEMIWSDEPFVEENRLTNSISVLRKTLEDDRSKPHYIETVPKHGYRFIAPVQILPAIPKLPEVESTSTPINSSAVPSEDNLPMPIEPKKSASPSRNKRFSRRIIIIGLVTIFVFCIIAGIWYFAFNKSSRRQSGQERIVVNSPTDEAEIRRVITESQFYENLTLYTHPHEFSEEKLNEYWLAESQGGKEIKEVKTSITRLQLAKQRYGEESKMLQFDFRFVKVFAPRDYAEVGTIEKWFLPLYSSDGSRVINKNPVLGPYPVEYMLRKVDGHWLIEETTTPRANPNSTPIQ